MAMTFTQTVPLDASDAERAAVELDLARFHSNLQESGMDPVVDVETTSGGDVFIIRAGDDDDGPLEAA